MLQNDCQVVQNEMAQKRAFLIFFFLKETGQQIVVKLTIFHLHVIVDVYFT